MNELATRRDELLAELQMLPDAHARLEYLIERARDLPPLPAALKTDERLVPGCLSNLWVDCSFREGRCVFLCAADSLVVKSIAGLLCSFYSGASPADIVALDPSFLRHAGITEHLSSNRRNALTRVWGLIRGFAVAHGG
jgi:cysteine desulfuration protein SufE